MHDPANLVSMALSGSGAKLARDYERIYALGEHLSDAMTPRAFTELVHYLHDADGFFDWCSSIALPPGLDAGTIRVLSDQILRLVADWDWSWRNCTASWELAVTRLLGSSALLAHVALAQPPVCYAARR